jgi:hypothetical protein
MRVDQTHLILNQAERGIKGLDRMAASGEVCSNCLNGDDGSELTPYLLV